MPSRNEPPPTPPRKPSWAYALVAAVIWALAAYDLIVQKPHPVLTLAAAGQGCSR